MSATHEPLWAPSHALDERAWRAATQECRQLLADLIALDTTNPPGRETQVAAYLQRLLEANGVASEVLESAPGRGNLVARLRGTGAKRPLLLLAHSDTVGVTPERWSSDPFTLVERDGHLYGRGVIDDKGMLAVLTVSLLTLARSRQPPARDVILLVEADEESGGSQGIGWMLECHPDRIDAEFAINEGGRTTITDHGQVWVGVQIAEKRGVNYTMTARGEAGHASMPRPDNPLVALGRALPRVAEAPLPIQLTPETRRFFRDLAPLHPGRLGDAMRELSESGSEAAARIVGEDLMLGAMLRHTVSPTIVRGGFRTNVIPASAEAVLNVRLLPGADPEAFRAELERRAGDERVLVTYPAPSRPEAPSTPFEGLVVDAVRRVATNVLPGAPVVPLLSAGATDSAQLRAHGIHAYGLLPFPLTTEDAARMHGDDERMPVASLETGFRLLFGTIAEVAAG